MNDTPFDGNEPDDEFGLPILPYAGSSGWSGSETSAARASQNDSNGTTSWNQTVTLALLSKATRDGLTWRELAIKADMHHGNASGVLSVLHKTGRIARLTDVRHKCKVYVHPLFVEGRDTEPYRANKPRVPSALADGLRALHPMLMLLGEPRCDGCFQEYPCKTIALLEEWA